jgi:hypothetical protein
VLSARQKIIFNLTEPKFFILPSFNKNQSWIHGRIDHGSRRPKIFILPSLDTIELIMVEDDHGRINRITVRENHG